MPFYQNVFNSEFVGSILTRDNQNSLNFSIPANRNSSRFMACYIASPYDLSTNTTLTFNYSFDRIHYTALAINVSSGAVSTSAVTNFEVVTALNANATFASMFVASVLGSTVQIKSIVSSAANFSAYISNLSAEIALGFNTYCGVKELIDWFGRHKIGSTLEGSVGCLIELDGSVTADRTIIRNSLGNQSWTTSDLKDNGQLLLGRSNQYTYQKLTIDGSNRITNLLEYGAGSGVGDLCRSITYTYSGSNTSPDTIKEQPKTIVLADLI